MKMFKRINGRWKIVGASANKFARRIIYSKNDREREPRLFGEVNSQ
jgi:hypothetical protein